MDNQAKIKRIAELAVGQTLVGFGKILKKEFPKEHSFSLSPVAHHKVGEVYILNKHHAEDAEIIVGNMAIGLMP